MAKILKLMPENEKFIAGTDDLNPENVDMNTESGDMNTESGDAIKRASFHWLIRRMCREARIEASLKAKQTIKVFNDQWFLFLLFN
jgi:hypothetical protein